jgi:hypothetical protein
MAFYEWTEVLLSEWSSESLSAWSEFSAEGTLNQLWRDESYVYVATSLGLDIIELATQNKVSYILYNGGFTTVWSSSDYVYLGTSSAGIKYLDKGDILEDAVEPVNISSILNDYNYFYNVSVSKIKHLHGKDTTLMVITSSGIDIIDNGASKPFKSTFNNTNVTKGFMMDNYSFYYVLQNSTTDGIFRMNSAYCDWDTPDVSYLTGGGFIPPSLDINDIFVTASTSVNTVDNTLFVATTAGVLVLDEGTSEFDAYYTK